MNKDDLFQVVKKNALAVLPGIQSEQITMDCQLKDLGANSIDRVEIVTLTLEDTQLEISLVEFGGVSNIRELVDVLYRKCTV